MRVKKWVTFHGLALNVNPNLKFFNSINPCGLDVKACNLSKYIDIEKIEWDVPYEIDGIVPLCAGKTLKWKISQNDEII